MIFVSVVKVGLQNWTEWSEKKVPDPFLLFSNQSFVDDKTSSAKLCDQ